MPRSYDTAVTALTLGVQFKWVDNLLSRHRIDGVVQASQGTTRRISPDAIVRIEIVRMLAADLGLSVGKAVTVGERIFASRAGAVEIGEGAGRLIFDIPAVERRLATRLSDAVESAPRRTRGRPPHEARH